MSAARSQPPTASHLPVDGWRWTVAGITSGSMVGLAAILLAHPAQALLDYPRVDALLRVGTPIALVLLVAGAPLALVTGTMAARSRDGLRAFVAGIVGAACLSVTAIFWAHGEAIESATQRTDIAEKQELLGAMLSAALDGRRAAAAQLAARTGTAVNEEWLGSARQLLVDFTGSRAVTLVGPDGSQLPGFGVPPGVALKVLAGCTLPTDMIRLGQQWAINTDDSFVMGVAAPGNRSLVLVIDPAELAARLQKGMAENFTVFVGRGTGLDGMQRDIVLPGAGTPAPAPNLPQFQFANTGLEWRILLQPTQEWFDGHHHRANTFVILLGTITAAACVAWIRAGARVPAAGARAPDASAARARIAVHAREALSQEASHVIRARLRETARALDTVTDPRSDATTREDALRRIGASLAQAESEVSALLETTAHTRIVRAEQDAMLEHLYAAVTLEFPGGPTVHLDRPVPPGTLAEVQRELGSTTFAVLTSDNPMSMPGTPHANMLRRSVLALELRNAGLVHRPVTGRNADGSWQEHGFAVAAGVGESDALAELHGQNAYYWFDGTAFSIHEMTGQHRTIRLPRDPTKQ